MDALLRASHAEGADAAKVSALTASVSKSLNQSAVMAKKKHDRAGESEAKALLAKLKPLAPAAAAPTAHAKAGRKR